MKKVLFICVHNSARSQMAEGFLRARYGDRFEALSAGTEPGKLAPLTVEVMEEAGIDVSLHRSKGLDEFAGMDIDYVVTVCDKGREGCPFFPGGKKVLHQAFADLSAAKGSEEERLKAFRHVRDEIGAWVDKTFGERGDLRLRDEAPLCVRCQKPVVARRSEYETFERMHWLCFHLEYEHAGDPDEPCEDPSCPLWHIQVFRRKLEELGCDPENVVADAIRERWDR